MLTFRPIRPEDDAAIAAIIRQPMTVFDAEGPSFALHDPEVDQALRLCTKLGFQPLCSPLGRTDHGGCDHWFAEEVGMSLAWLLLSHSPQPIAHSQGQP